MVTATPETVFILNFNLEGQDGGSFLGSFLCTPGLLLSWSNGKREGFCDLRKKCSQRHTLLFSVHEQFTNSVCLFVYLIAYEFHYQGHLFTRGFRIHELFVADKTAL